MGILGGIANVLGVDEFGKAIISVIGFVVEILGDLMFYVGDALTRIAIETNFLLPASPAVTEGLKVTIPIANLALVVGIVIIAIAVMVRAEWIVTAKEALPKLFTALLLINFTYFSLVNVVISNVDKATVRIYEAANYNADTFRGIFKPDFNIREIIKIRFAFSKDPGGVNKYFEMQNQIGAGVVEALAKLNNALPAGTDVTSQQARTIVNYTSNILTSWVSDPVIQDGGSWWGIVAKVAGAAVLGTIFIVTAGTASIPFLLITGITATTLSITAVQDTIQNISDSLHVDWRIGDLQNGIDGSLRSGGVDYANIPAMEIPIATYIDDIVKATQTAANDHFGCVVGQQKPGDIPGCKTLATTGALIHQELGPWEDVAATLAEVLFKTIWIFIGTLTLFGFATMFFMRYVVLSLLVVLFPIAWLGWIFPKISGAAGGKNIWTSWWSQFMRWLLFGPIGMFFVFLAIKVASELGQVNPITNLSGNAGGLMAMAAASIADMLVVVGMLIGGLYTANKMGIAGSKIFYGSMIKARGWAAKKIKKGAKGIFVNKHTKAWAQNAKLATKDKGLGLLTKDLRSVAGGDATQKLLESKNVVDRFRGRRRLARAAMSRETSIDREKKKHFMHRNEKGELVENAPFMNSQILSGLLKNPGANREALAAAYQMMGEGKILPFESDAQQLLAYATEQTDGPGGAVVRESLIKEYGLQKAENKLKEQGYGAKTYSAVADSAVYAYRDDETEARREHRLDVYHATQKDIKGRDNIRIATPILSDWDEKNSNGSSQPEHDAARHGTADLLTIDRSDKLATNFAQQTGSGKRFLAEKSKKVRQDIEDSVSTLYGPGFGTFSLDEQLEFIQALSPAQIAQTTARLGAQSTALGEYVSSLSPDRVAPELARIFRDNARAISDSTAMGALLGATTPE